MAIGEREGRYPLSLRVLVCVSKGLRKAEPTLVAREYAVWEFLKGVDLEAGKGGRETVVAA